MYVLEDFGTNTYRPLLFACFGGYRKCGVWSAMMPWFQEPARREFHTCRLFIYYITSPIVSKWVLLEKKKNTRKILIILWWYCFGCSPLYGQLFSQRVHPKPRLYTFSNCKHALGLRLQLQHVLISFMFHKPVFHDSPSIW